MKRLQIIEALETILLDGWDKEGPASEGGRAHIFEKLEVIQEFLSTSSTQMVVNCKDCIHSEEKTDWQDKEFLICSQLANDDGAPEDGKAHAFDDSCGCCSSGDAHVRVSPSFGCVLGEEEEEDEEEEGCCHNGSIPQWVISNFFK